MSTGRASVHACMLLHKKLLSPRKHVVVESIVFKFLVLQSYAHLDSLDSIMPAF